MQYLDFIRWWIRHPPSGHAAELKSLEATADDEVDCHIRYGLWLSDLVTNDMSITDQVTFLAWAASSSLRIAKSAQDCLYVLGW